MNSCESMFLKLAEGIVTLPPALDLSHSVTVLELF